MFIRSYVHMFHLIFLAKLNLIDLAGSGRMEDFGVSGAALTETTNINKSLSALSTLLIGLQHNPQCASFRSSALTSLLKDSLSKIVVHFLSTYELNRTDIVHQDYS